MRLLRIGPGLKKKMGGVKTKPVGKLMPGWPRDTSNYWRLRKPDAHWFSEKNC
jgi:hypothetical protein